MSVICVIPARGGSKRIRDKNLRTVGGVSLVGRAVFAAREFVRLEGIPDGRIIVDTDSGDIAAEARAWGAEVPFLRAPELATDTTSSADSTLALMDRLQSGANDSDVVVLLQPTSPLRSVGDIRTSWARFLRSGERQAVTTVIAAADHVVEIDGDGTISGIAKSANQEGPIRQQQSRLSGAVYVISVALLRKHRTFVPLGETVALDTPADRSVDVDEEPDLAQAEGLLRRTRLDKLAIGGREIGGSNTCFIIAEAGVNHNGDVALAHRLVDIAAESGSDAVKFQTFDPALLVSDLAPKAEYQLATTSRTQSQREMLDALSLPQSAFRELASHAREAGILFLSTPFDERSADFLEELGCPAFKVASGELTNHRLLRALASKARPMLVSTGMATMAEVADAVNIIRSCDNQAIGLFHCVTNYPAAPRDCNLEAMSSMRTMFGVPVGWSDHTDGIVVSIAAAAMGAELIEKHFTIDRTMDGPDHRASLEPKDLTEMVRAVRDAQSSRGDGVKRPAASELANLSIVRRSLHAARDLAEGHSLGADDLVFLRPGGGIPPQAEKHVLGRHLTRAVSAGERIDESDVR